MRTRRWMMLWCALALSLPVCLPAAARAAEGAAAEWRLEQPHLPGVSWPVPLGSVGDVEFFEPNRGLLITGGNGDAVGPGVWTYDGQSWHELSNKCGAAHNGRIAWAGPDEFWTVSDGRPGQAGESVGTQFEKKAPLEDNTLCHFQNGQIVASYAHPAFEANSYQVMRGAACIAPTDCWFGGERLPEPQIGSFHLHWNGVSLEEEPYPTERFPVYEMRALGERIFESVLAEMRLPTEPELAITPALHVINPPGVIPQMEPENEAGAGLPIYERAESAQAVSYLHLAAADGMLWAAAGLVRPPGQLTIAIREGGWRLLIGPTSPGGAQLPEPVLPPAEAGEEERLFEGKVSGASVAAIAAEPGTESAWIALGIHNAERAVLIHVDAEGHLLDERTFPSAEERAAGHRRKGRGSEHCLPGAERLLAGDDEGLAVPLGAGGERTLPANGDPGFGQLISYRPPDQGLPQVGPDAPPEDTSGLQERGVVSISVVTTATTEHTPEKRVKLPLLSHLSRRLRGDTLEMTFHLSVKARLRLLAKRKRQVIAATPMHTFDAGERKLLLKLNPHNWPTKLSLQTHALQPLRTVSSVGGEGANINTETTGLFVSPFANGARPGLVP